MIVLRTMSSAVTKPQPLILITGASSGIGAATAEIFARAGWRVALTARTEKALREVEARIAPHAAGVQVLPLDAANGEAVLREMSRLTAEIGTPDVLVNCAGAGQWKFIEDTPPAEAKAMMDAPYFAAFHFTHALMPGMLKRGRGQVIHVNSPVSALGWPGATGYAAARWALRGLHESLCLDLAGTGVRSTHIVFGKVASEYFKNNPGSEEHLPAIARLVPLLTPEECARVIFGAVKRPRREIRHPLMLKVFYGMNAVVPGVVRALAVRTGRRHG